MMAFLFLTSWIFPIMFLFLKHPLSLGMALLLQTLIVALITGLLNYNFWFSYILFLIMIGGMLILFIYMTSIASNEKFKFSLILLVTSLTLLLISALATMMDQFSLMNILSVLDLQSWNNSHNNQLSMTKYLNWPTNYIMYMMFIYLLITLILVVKVTDIQYGPIRQKF